MRNLLYEHPNNGWQGITAPCDARNFKILMNWDVRTEFTPDEMHFELGGASLRHYYKLHGMDLFELAYLPHSDCWVEFACSGLYNDVADGRVVEVRKPNEERIQIIPVDTVILPQMKLVMTCPSSDPVGTPMPIKLTGGHKLWLLPLPEEMFGFKGGYVRILI